MGIRGSLELLSLPEVLQIISNGRKTGKLSILYYAKDDSTSEIIRRDIWFKNGKFICLVNPSSSKLLINILRKEELLSPNQLVKLYRETRNLTVTLGDYCVQNSFLESDEVTKLFKCQLKSLADFLSLEEGKFEFEDSESFPLIEMTGKSYSVEKIILKYMRSLPKLSRQLKQQIPQTHNGVIRLESDHDVSLLPIENCLLDGADGESSLKKIAQKTLFEISDLQYAALGLILIGLIDEVPVSNYDFSTAASKSDNLFQAVSINNNQEKKNSSLIGNLVSFLRNKF